MSHPNNHEWVKECTERNLDPEQIFTVKEFVSEIGVSLEEMKGISWYKHLFVLAQDKEVKEL